MLGKRRVAWAVRLLVTDALALLLSFAAAYELRVLLDQPLGRAAAPIGYYTWLLALIVPVWIGLMAALGAYGVGWTVRSRAWLVIRVCAIGQLGQVLRWLSSSRSSAGSISPFACAASSFVIRVHSARCSAESPRASR